ncbi:hypothetical protein CHU93_02045 [Sandarakinorhabdus cyanobacteriorum]|uniref:DUF4148 domain-containing protein n=1 Tax=Sandarakinorhabdus cyanobacteriorum TaxID=1981098 RepID=A0A255Z2E2_9SPHN|nr:hypothetical protein [Sandarakinorhabdus cyanobacteriorum]OYQ35065.1 hypothetical protein CHU93_02045 [Sandarakinorhabdus cyanobacteriorum]
MRLIAAAAVAAMALAAVPATACAFDGMPGYSHYAPDGTDPYAGAYAEAAARIAEQRRQEAIENARLAMLKRLGMKDGGETAVASAATAPTALANATR